MTRSAFLSTAAAVLLGAGSVFSIALACCGAERALDLMHYHLPNVFVAIVVLLLAATVARACWRGARFTTANVCHLGLACVLVGWLAGLYGSPAEGSLRLRAGETGSVNDEWQFTLDDFTIDRWPDTGTVRQYTSYGRVAGEAEPVTVSVNHPLVRKGWWVYQNSYQEMTNPHTGRPLYFTILLCVKDSGLPWVAAGGLLLLVGALTWCFIRRAPVASGSAVPCSGWRWLLFAAYALSSVFSLALLVHRSLSTGHAPMQNMYEFLICTAAVLPLLTCLALRRDGGLLPPVVDFALQLFVLVPVLFFMDGSVKRLMPALQSPLFVPHVGAYVAGYVILVRAALGVGRSLVPAGFFLLTVGLVLGSLWGKVCWGHWWQFDPKEMWSLATWLSYAAYFHVRPRLTVRGERFFLIAGAVLIVLTLTWINLSRMFTGMHSYA